MTRYRRTGVIGRGATSVVYAAHDTLLDRPVALKEIHLDQALELALEEARAAARITHPSVVTVHDVFAEGGMPVIAMELLEGPTLREVLEQMGSLPLERTLGIGARVASSLAAAHTAGVIHRDIKPDNIFVLRNDRVVVTDFGMALTTLRGGTPGYMAPEQWRDEPTLPATDVFAWGCVIAECATGDPLFGFEGDLHEIERRTCSGGVDLTTGWPALDDLLRRCTSASPRHRPGDGSMLQAAVEECSRAPLPVVGALSQGEFAPAESPSGGLEVLLYTPDGGVSPLVVPPGGLEFGREADVSVADPMMSRRHARIGWEQGMWVVTDLGSLNGTVRNGAAIQRGHLEPGDVVTFGSTVMRVGGT